MTTKHIYVVANQLKAARTINDKLRILLSDTHAPFYDPTEVPEQAWTAAHETGMIKLLLKDLLEPTYDPVSHRVIVYYDNVVLELLFVV